MARKPESVLVWGAGEHGRVVAEIARAAGCQVLGFIDAAQPARVRVVDAAGARVVLSEDELIACVRGNQPLPLGATAVIPAVGNNRIRFEQVNVLGALLAPPIAHPTAVISPSATVAAGTVIGALAVINTGARVGRGVIVNTAALIGHDCTVEDGAHISSRVVLTGGVQVGARALVGAGAVVLPRVVVGVDAVVGAGAVALKNLADGVTVAGVPARVIESKHHGSGSQSHLSIGPAPVGA
jgi:sugar O-acyltransferase (sialic acid O-acetyltransferase NeuD family)